MMFTNCTRAFAFMQVRRAFILFLLEINVVRNLGKLVHKLCDSSIEKNIAKKMVKCPMHVPINSSVLFFYKNIFFS